MKPKYVFLTFLSLLLIFEAQAQQLERVVVNTTGGSFSASNGSLISNLGELVISTQQNSTTMLTQGFLQPTLPLTTSLETLYQELGFSYYPNPASYAFTLESEAQYQIKRVIFHDMTGRLVKSLAFGQHPLNIETLQSGVYLVQALDQSGTPIHSFKLVKQ